MKKSLLNLVAVCGFSLLVANVYAEQGSKGIARKFEILKGVKLGRAWKGN